MNSDRRIFMKRLVISGTGIIICGSSIGRLLPGSSVHLNNISGEDKNDEVNFPFFSYLKSYNIGDYISKDQGGKFIQMELLRTEDDQLIVEKIRSGLLEEVFGNPINWNYRNDGQLEKTVWLNRFYFLPSFARMYYLSGDISYLNDMIKTITRWIENNPLLPDSHAKNYNWRDMQVAWRTIHWSWCYFITEKTLSEGQKTLILNSLKQHAAILLEGFGKQPMNEFNHQSHGALAMLYLGILFPTFESADELRQTALKILEHHLEKAFYPDGGNVEQMFGYYPFETHLFRDTYLLCSQNNVKWPVNLLPMLEKMAKFLSAVAQPDGTMPPVNDSYEMTTIPMLTVLNDILDKRIDVQAKSSAYFPDTQIAVIRGNNQDNNWYILANPAKSIGAHAHAGRLAFTLWYNKQPVLIDSGCCNYDDPQLVKWYRTSKAHNTVLIDGKTDEATSTNQLWAPKRITENQITDWLEDDSFTFCRMVSPANETVNSSVAWSRSLALVKNEFLVLHDCFESTDEHNYELLFHFPPVPVSTDNPRKTIKIFETNPMVVIPADSEMIENLSISEGLVSIKGVSTPGKMATLQFTGKGTVHSVIVFMPQGNDFTPIKIQQKITKDGIGVNITKGENMKTVLLMKNPKSEKLSVYGQQTQNLFDVY